MCLYEAYATAEMIYYHVIIPNHILELEYHDGTPIPLSLMIQVRCTTDQRASCHTLLTTTLVMLR
jgi:hypothetical protein